MQGRTSEARSGIRMSAGILASTILAALTEAELAAILRLSAESALQGGLSAEFQVTLGRLAALDVADPSGLVSVRVALVGAGSAGICLSPIGRSVVDLARPRLSP